MRRVALTGGIATGKSSVRRRFAHHGVPTIDADVLAHAIIAPGTPGAARILARFGAAVLSPDGGIDRKTLGAMVFADPAARRDLEAIVHPAVYQAITAWYAALPPAPFAVADIPLLYETGREADFDVVVVAACEPDEQLRRVLARDGLPLEAARLRIAAQWPIADKARRADHVIRTDGSHDATDAQVDALVAALSV
jgi:dephospho-CoA kinase